MAQAPEFKYAPMFQVGEDTTEYYHLTSEHVSLGNFEGKEILKVTPRLYGRQLYASPFS